MKSHYTFTTPIFYASGEPHIGHLYSVLVARILTNHFRQKEKKVFFQSGLDEHGEKIERKAMAQGIPPEEFVNQIAAKWKDFYKKKNLAFDCFLRTSQDKIHYQFVQTILQKLFDQGDLYQASYEGYYCVECEAYLSETERDEKNHCLIHRIPTEFRSEKNYYFRLSSYRETLLKKIEEKEMFLQARYRAEIKGLLSQDLGDLSISRPKSRSKWGIELPFDSEHIAYVWFDALPNYLSAHLKNHFVTHWEELRTSPFWKNTTHIIGKDILKFHGLYWPAMLLALDLPLPKLLVTGWILSDAQKISKSIGNFVDFEQFGARSLDALISYLLQTPLGEDVTFQEENLKQHYKSFLSNLIGNLHSRLLKMILQYFEGSLPAPKSLLDTKEWKDLEKEQERLLEQFDLPKILQLVYGKAREIDQYLSHQAPWKLWKAGEKGKVEEILQKASLEFFSLCSFLSPFFPETIKQIQSRFLYEEEKLKVLDEPMNLYPRF